MFQGLTRRMLRPPAFGLDISDLTVKFIRMVEQRGNRERFCVVSLPEEKSFVRVLEIPKMKADDVGNAVRWEVEGVIPLPLAEIYFDHELMPPFAGADHQDVLLTAFPRVIVDNYHHALVAAGFVPIALELESQAITRAIITENLARTPTIIIDIGATRTSFIIAAADSIVFTKSITVGGRNFEHAIAAALGLDADQARKTKIEVGLDRRAVDGKVFDALVPELTAITAELE